MAFYFSKLKLCYLRKMNDYPQFSFWITKALAKFCLLRIVLNHAKVSLYARSVSVVTKVGTVFNNRLERLWSVMKIEASLPCEILTTFASLLKRSERGPYVHYS